MWGGSYWPAWLGLAVLTFLVPEIYALATNVRNTLSWWVWDQLHIAAGESPTQWSAVAFLTFGVWLVMVVWLTFHFWFRRFM